MCKLIRAITMKKVLVLAVGFSLVFIGETSSFLYPGTRCRLLPQHDHMQGTFAMTALPAYHHSS